jgi:tetratricopeptide (TPR) repeat protein
MEDVLHLEQDLNWRSFSNGLKGLLLFRIGDSETAVEFLRASVEGACIFLPNFDDVARVYCQSCYTLGSILFEKEDLGNTREALLCFLRCLPIMYETLPDVFIGNVFGFLDLLHSRLDRDDEALVFAGAAAHVRQLDDQALYSLMLSYANVDDMDRAKKVYEQLVEHGSDETTLQRARDFARRRLHGG